jgi:uncharacterized repeat protein (TIGR03803 family)
MRGLPAEGEIVRIFAVTAFMRTMAAILSLVWAVVPAPTAQAQKFKVLHLFTGGTDGGQPYAGLTLDSAGNLYGAAFGGGIPGCLDGCGTVFQLTPSAGGWSESVLYEFPGGTDGANPRASLTFDRAGNLYGTTLDGGTVGCGTSNGVAFELSPGSGNWTETVLYSFGGEGGCNPIAALTFDKAGNLYSTFPNSGTYGAGIAYELTQSAGGWDEKILYSFDGWEPGAPVIVDTAGNLYSTTPIGGSGHGGTVWELMHGSWKEKTLYAFTGPGGANPAASLAFDKAGNLYGQTESGGKYGRGVVFKLAPGAKGRWKDTVLYSFKGGLDGEYPISSVPVFDRAGNIYGTTTQGGGTGCGGKGCGIAFKLTRGASGKWRETVLHRFNDNDGRWPYYGVAIDNTGNLYGTTAFGGNAGCFDNYGCGVVFEITP